MPEGDTVCAAARRLDEALAGRVLLVSDFRVPRYATVDLTGRTVLAVVARGKHLLTRIDGDVTVHTHLKMEGRWQVRPAGERTPRDHRVRLVLANAEWQAVGYSLGVVELVRTAREDTVVGHLGPDLLGPDWDPAEAVRRLAERPERPIAEALLDQTALAGIGNVYKSETLFLRGIHPWRPTGEVTGLIDLVNLAHKLLEVNKDRYDRATTGVRRPGQELWVYGRAGRPCRRCGTRLRRSDQQDRVTFWCPHCQPEHE